MTNMGQFLILSILCVDANISLRNLYSVGCLKVVYKRDIVCFSFEKLRLTNLRNQWIWREKNVLVPWLIQMELNVAVFFKVELSLPINTCTLASSHFYLSVYWHQGFYWLFIKWPVKGYLELLSEIGKKTFPSLFLPVQLSR